MAVLVAVGGALLGNAIGIGASAGWVIGSIVGNLLFPQSGPDTFTEGPRLGDLTVTSSAYGASIPITYGTIRMAGNMIWSTGIEEVKNTQKQKTGGGGGKGGGGGGGATQTTVTYEYFATFALGFSEGVADDVLRMWADGKLIYDKRGLGDDITKAGLRFRFYPGDETQEPDGLIEGDKGVDATPANRGLCYIVFERLPLKDFGNRIPNITAEITFEGSTDQPTSSLDFFTVAEGGLTDTFITTTIRPDFTRGVFYFSHSTVTVGSNVLRRAQIRTMKEDRQKAYTLDALGNDVKFLKVVAVLLNGSVIVATGSANTRPISMIDPNTLAIVSTFGVENAGLNNDPQGFEVLAVGMTSWIQAQGPDGLQHYVFTGSIFNSLGLLRADGSLTYVWDSDNGSGGPTPTVASNARILGTCAGALGDNFGEGYAMAGPSYTSARAGDVNVYKMTVDSGAFFDSVSSAYVGTGLAHVVTLTPGQVIPGETLLRNVKGPVYDLTDDTIMFQAEADSDGTEYMLKIDPTNGSILWRSVVPNIRNQIAGMNHSRVTNGVYGQVDVTRSWALRTATGEVFHDQTGWAKGQGTNGASWWDGKTNTLIGSDTDDGITKWLLFRGSGTGAGLDAVVSDLCLRVGLAASDIDVTDLASQAVPGYTIGRRSTVRGSIQPLASVYFFDGVESDYVLKFLLRDGRAVAADVPQRDLAVLDDSTGEFFRENRIQDVELPLRFTMTYMDKDNDYLQAAHNAQRMSGPLRSMYSRNEMGLQIAAALSVTFAKQATEKALYTSWIERSNYSAQLSWTYLALDPSDVVTITLDDGTVFRTRFVQTDIGLGFTVDVSALSEDAAQYTSSVLSDGGVGGPAQEFLSVVITKLILLCSPLLRDSDDVGRSSSTLYFLMGGFGQPGWTAGTLFKSAEGTEYAAVGSVVDEMSWGSAANALGDASDPFATDEANTLTVFMNTGVDDLASVTQLEMVNGANPAALVHANGVDAEIIQFRDVTVNADGSRTLGGLLRGRRGTDTFTDGHAVGDTFVLLDATVGGRVPLALGEKGLTRFYKAVTSGQLFEEATIDTKASPLNDLKPYRVVQEAATLEVGDDVTLTWVRRTRVGGGLQDGTGDVPLSEDTEEYELEIFDGPGGTEVREILALTSPTFLYTSAQQTADGLTPPLAQVTIRAHQVSVQVGRGFSEEVTIDVE